MCGWSRSFEPTRWRQAQKDARARRRQAASGAVGDGSSARGAADHEHELRNGYPAIAPGYHLNKRHWNTITLDGGLAEQLVCDLIEDSYDLVVSALPRRVRAQLSWAPDVAQAD